MSPATLLDLLVDGRGNTARIDGARWLASVRRLEVAGDLELVTGEEETCAIVLSGTFDLVGGTTAWPSRGARTSPLHGRPVAVFLPPRTRFAAQNGNGEILLLGARQPEVEAPTGREALQHSPLLKMAGSGKAFDPGSGEWRPAETFPSAPESLPPRRILRLQLGATIVERVFAADYKAATLSVDELVVPAATTFALRDLPLPPLASEWLVYLRSEGDVELQGIGDVPTLRGERALWQSGTAAPVTIVTKGTPAYVVLAHAGK